MSKKEKFWYLLGPTLISLCYTITSPIIHVYFISLIEPRIVAIANLINTSFAAIINYTIQIDYMKEWYRKHFKYIVVLDIICFSLITFSGYQYPELRFIGFAFLNAITSILWVMIMKNLVNKLIIDGDARTDFEALEDMVLLIASCIGSLLAIILIDIPIEYCLILQCIANLIMGITDMYTFKLLKRAYI